MIETTETTENMETELYQIRGKLAELEEMLETKQPGMKTILQSIHRELRHKPGVVTLLEEAEIKTLITGLKAVSSVEIATTALKTKAGGRGKALKNITVADL